MVCILYFLLKSDNNVFVSSIPNPFETVYHFQDYFNSLEFTFDFFLALISAAFGFLLLLILLILKETSFHIWVIRKTIHFLGGTFIAFIVLLFKHYLGVLIAVGFFLVSFIILVLFSRVQLLKEYIILRNCRDNEGNYSFLLNTIATLLTLFAIYLVSYFLFNEVLIFTLGALIISWADTAGEVLGRTIPTLHFKIFSRKSLIGSVGVLLASVLSFVVIILIMGIPIDNSLLTKIFASGVICMLIEILCWKWFDNILLPITGSILMLWII